MSLMPFGIRRLLFFAAMVGLLAKSAAVFATSIEQLASDELIERSELVFEGTVLDVKTHRHSKNMIITEVRFDVQDVVSGHHEEQELVLRFAGGKVANTTMQIAEMIYPRKGEQGVYFVESTQRQLVNPLVGWAQGHFVYARDAKAKQRVCTAMRMPISTMEFVPRSQRSARAVERFQGGRVNQAHRDFSHGYARGVRLATSLQALDSAMTREEFKAKLKARVRTLKINRDAHE